MKSNLYFPEIKNFEVSRTSSDVISVVPKLGRGRGLAITFKNELLNNAKSDSRNDSSFDINMNDVKKKIKAAREKIDRVSESSDTVKSEDEIIICSKNEQEDDLEKTYSMFQCWPSVDDKIWKCWDKSGKDRDKDEDDDSDYLVDYAPLVASYPKASFTTYPKASVKTYPKASVTTYPTPKVASLEISTGNEWPVSNIPKVCLYETMPYSLSVPIKCLPRKYFNKLNSGKTNGEYSYRFDTGFDPNLSMKNVNEDKYSQFHKKVRVPYTRKINYWKSKQRDDKIIDESSEVKDPVSALYIWCSRNRAIPTFTFTNEIEYERKVIIGMVFVCKIKLYEREIVGKGTNKKESKRVAAQKMLEIINSGFVEHTPEEDADKKKKVVSDEEADIKVDEEEKSDSDEEEKSDSDAEEETDSDVEQEGENSDEVKQVKSNKTKKEKSDKKKIGSDNDEKSDAGVKDKTESDEKEKAESDEKEKTKSDEKEKTEIKKKEKTKSDEKEMTEIKKKEKTELDKEEETTESDKEEEKTESDKEDKTESGKEKKAYLNEQQKINSKNEKKMKPKKIRSDKEKAESDKKVNAVLDEKNLAKKNVNELSDVEFKKSINPISFLQEICMREKWTVPDYKIESFGSIFKCQIHMFVKGQSVEESGFGHTKKEAKAKAAVNVLGIVEERNFLSKSD